MKKETLTDYLSEKESQEQSEENQDLYVTDDYVTDDDDDYIHSDDKRRLYQTEERKVGVYYPMGNEPGIQYYQVQKIELQKTDDNERLSPKNSLPIRDSSDDKPMRREIQTLKETQRDWFNNLDHKQPLIWNEEIPLLQEQEGPLWDEKTNIGIYHIKGNQHPTQENEHSVGILPEEWNNLSEAQQNEALKELAKQLQQEYENACESEKGYDDFFQLAQLQEETSQVNENFIKLDGLGSSFISTIIDITEQTLSLTTAYVGTCISFLVMLNANNDVVNFKYLNTNVHNLNVKEEQETIQETPRSEKEGGWKLSPDLHLTRSLGHRTAKEFGLSNELEIDKITIESAQLETAYIGCASYSLIEKNHLTLDTIAELISTYCKENDYEQRYHDEATRLIVDQAIKNGCTSHVSLCLTSVHQTDLTSYLAAKNIKMMTIIEGHGGNRVSKMVSQRCLPLLIEKINAFSKNDHFYKEKQEYFYHDLFIKTVASYIEFTKYQDISPKKRASSYQELLLDNNITGLSKHVMIVAILTDSELSDLQSTMVAFARESDTETYKKKILITIQKELKNRYSFKQHEKLAIYLEHMLKEIIAHVNYKHEIHLENDSQWLSELELFCSGHTNLKNYTAPHDKNSKTPKSQEILEILWNKKGYRALHDKNNKTPKSQGMLKNPWSKTVTFEIKRLDFESCDIHFLSTTNGNLSKLNLKDKVAPIFIQQKFNHKITYYFYGAKDHNEFVVTPLEDGKIQNIIESCKINACFERNEGLSISSKDSDPYKRFFDYIKTKKLHAKFSFFVVFNKESPEKLIKEYITKKYNTEDNSNDFSFEDNGSQFSIFLSEDKEEVFIEAIYYAAKEMALQGIQKSIDAFKIIQHQLREQIREATISYDDIYLEANTISNAYAHLCQEMLLNESTSLYNKYHIILFILFLNRYELTLQHGIRKAIGCAKDLKPYLEYNAGILKLIDFQTTNPMPDLSPENNYLKNALAGIESYEKYSLVNNISNGQKIKHITIFKELLNSSIIHPFKTHVIYAFLLNIKVETTIKEFVSKEMGFENTEAAKKSLETQFTHALRSLYPSHQYQNALSMLLKITKQIIESMNTQQNFKLDDCQAWLPTLISFSSGQYFSSSVAENTSSIYSIKNSPESRQDHKEEKEENKEGNENQDNEMKYEEKKGNGPEFVYEFEL